MKSIKNSNIILLSVILLAAAGCDEKIPIKEMALAKYEITRALSVKADKYAPDELKQAKDKLMESHALIKEEKLEESQKSAVTSHEKAALAYEKSLPLLARDTIDIAEKSLESADEAYAKVLAEDEFKQANDSMVTANEQFEQKKYYDSYETALVADTQAKEARNVALSKKNILADAIAEVKSILDEAGQYNALEYAPEKFKSAQENVQAGSDALDELMLKKGFAAVEIARVEADEAYQQALDASAKARIGEAKDVLTQAEASEGAEVATDELNGAKESLALAESLYAESKFKESITSSEESIRLSTIVINTEKKIEVAVTDQEGVEKETKEEPEKEKEVTEEKEYVIYKVKYRPERRDCLWRIAGEFYEKPIQWKKIYNANKEKINDPDLIWPNMLLKIPKPVKTTIQENKTIEKEDVPEEKAEEESINENDTEEAGAAE